MSGIWILLLRKKLSDKYHIIIRRERIVLKKIQSFLIFLKKSLANMENNLYTKFCCDMIAVKREVAI